MVKNISNLYLYYYVLQAGNFALIEAACDGRVDIVQKLVDYGAAVNLRNRVTFYKIIVLRVVSIQNSYDGKSKFRIRH